MYQKLSWSVAYTKNIMQEKKKIDLSAAIKHEASSKPPWIS